MFNAVHVQFLAATASKSNSSSIFVYVLLIGFVGIYFLWLRPQRNKLRQQQQQNRVVELGDEIVTTSGIVGVVQTIEGDKVIISTGHGATMTILRAAIARRVEGLSDNGDSPPSATDGGGAA